MLNSKPRRRENADLDGSESLWLSTSRVVGSLGTSLKRILSEVLRRKDGMERRIVGPERFG
jgi:hypothetical protein